MAHILTIVSFLFFGFSLTAQESELEKWKRQSDEQLTKFKKESNEELHNFIEGWDNDFFSVEDLESQPPVAEGIANEDQIQTSTGNSPRLPISVTSTIKMWAIVIGVANYSVESLELNYSDDDAQNFARFLASPEGGSIPEDRLFILIDEDAHQDAVHRTIQQVYNRATEGDGIIFYFSGHGSTSAFALHDAGTAAGKGLLTHKFLNDQINVSKAKYKYCVIDACHSAGMVETNSKNISEMSKLNSFYAELDKSLAGSVYLLSSREDETSIEARNADYKLRGGIFTYFLMQGLRGEADYNADKIITVVEAFNYCKENVAIVTDEKQNPVISGEYSLKMPIGILRF